MQTSGALSLDKALKLCCAKKREKETLTPSLANISLRGGGFVKENHSHGDRSIWENVVKETRHIRSKMELEKQNDPEVTFRNMGLCSAQLINKYT